MDEVNKLKRRDGKDIIVYGSANFGSYIGKYNLIDKYHLFINPTAIGKGLSIFSSLKEDFKLNLVESKSFGCGIVLNH